MKIGDLCESVSHTFNKKQGNVILINTSDIFDGEVLNHKYVPNKNLRGQFKKSFQQDDILYSEIRPKNRRFAYINFNANDYIASTKLMVIRSKDKILPQFLFQLLKSDDIINQLQSLAETRSGTFPQITFSELAALDICIPTISEQKEIAYILNTFDEKIANNKNINHHLEQIAQAIFKSWFVDFEPFNNNAFINTEIGEIPKGWNVLSLGEVCDIKGGKRLPRGKNLITTPNNHPYIRVRDMNDVIFIQMNDAIEYVCDEIQNTISRYIVSTDDVLISIVGTIGMVCKVHSSLNNANLTENCVKLTNIRGVTSDFLYFFLSSLNGQEAIKQGTVGAVQAKLPMKNIQAIRFPCPPSKVITEFDSIINYIMQLIANNCSENRRLTTIRDTLLPRLMSGELRVSDIESAK